MITLITERATPAANGKRQNQLINYQKRKSAEKQLKTILMNKTGRHQSADFCVVITNSKRQGRGKRGHVLQIQGFKYM